MAIVAAKDREDLCGFHPSGAAAGADAQVDSVAPFDRADPPWSAPELQSMKIVRDIRFFHGTMPA